MRKLFAAFGSAGFWGLPYSSPANRLRPLLRLQVGSSRQWQLTALANIVPMDPVTGKFLAHNGMRFVCTCP